MKTVFERFTGPFSGTTPGEYGLMSSLLGVAVMIFIGELGTDLVALFG